ncbi:hypothetical protein A8924_0602 [Saccharopolyspora erythraea NRRL 2338]|uniref:Uncharacterized protein n=2 Tax=Saccharopolyspora erythraea TaxID=1836 RepID=A4F691_SACEN|nr:hypothetical protein [Saccharopolyspora erythraea]EQD88049.1 hypothetical protein N599_01080 [Saccharopolyspora erythraea D]PFG93367.1 hypothetical protein A8924_0602 [Saccharopolyspora erythraea NRRL 2338]QRK90203.1 hypothetical protein JQX30_01070 [Saccharopolyspora erythraea]CAL99565.1 hypothetical protein SACE_0213 [Saccharopolyspora erythraea NRRL 2338]
MHKRFLLGAVALSSGLLATASPALADSVDNDGVNVANGNNVSLLPIQLCGNDIAIVGAVVEALSTTDTKCVNAPIVDHPSQETGDVNVVVPPKPKPEHEHHKPKPKPKPEFPCAVKPPFLPGQLPCAPAAPGPAAPAPAPSAVSPVSQAQPQVQAAALPTAPAPSAVLGHVAVTG